MESNIVVLRLTLIRVTQFMRRPRSSAFSIERLYEDIRGALPDDFRVSVWTCRNLSSGFWPRLKDIWGARAAQGDVNHVTGDVHFLTLLLDSRRTILTVHDLVMLGRLRGIKRWVLWLLWYWLPVMRSRAVVVISESTRAQLLASVGCDPRKIVVIHDAVSDEFRAMPRPFHSGCPRILQVGTSENKNIARVAEALGGIRCRLVIIGQLATPQFAALERHHVEYENYVNLSRDGLLAQYVASDMLIFTSTYEGFGLPIVEANAVGRPVVTSDVCSMPEVAGDAACLVNPFDVRSMRAGVQRVIDDELYRRHLVEAGFRNVERFRTPLVAEQYAALYREVSAKASMSR